MLLSLFERYLQSDLTECTICFSPPAKAASRSRRVQDHAAKVPGANADLKFEMAREQGFHHPRREAGKRREEKIPGDVQTVCEFVRSDARRQETEDHGLVLWRRWVLAWGAAVWRRCRCLRHRRQPEREWNELMNVCRFHRHRL